jgi:3-hydroxyisobutyrate dehydrogenase and related beta-hydroxyacid dehydrogenases
MAKGLHGEGLANAKAFDIAMTLGGSYRQTVEDRAKDAGVTLLGSIEDVIAASTVVFCAVQAQYAKDVAEKALPVMRPEVIFADVTTARPSQKESIAEGFNARGFMYVDAAMLGSLPVNMHKVPMLCSGKGAEELIAAMKPYNMDMEFMRGAAGMASRLKLVRSSYTKGTEALATETLLLAHKLGLEQEVLDSLDASSGKPTFAEAMLRQVRSSTIHAERRAHEVEDSVSLMEECGIEPVMGRAVIERMKRTAGLGLKEDLKGVTPKTKEEVFALWDAKKYS